jgi:hypothetical protein
MHIILSHPEWRPFVNAHARACIPEIRIHPSFVDEPVPFALHIQQNRSNLTPAGHSILANTSAPVRYMAQS